MSRIRVVVVDDSAVIRRLVSDVLGRDSEIEVVGTAGDGATALAKIAALAPDLVTLDVEMPDRSGLEVLLDIRKIAPKLPVIMFSSLTQRAGATTLEALARGASDYVTKPTGTTREAAIAHVRDQLVPKVKMLTMRGASPLAQRPLSRPSNRPQLLAIGTSTGGPNALTQLFARIPASFPIPIVLVQHMPPTFTRLLAERLSTTSPLSFSEATHGALLRPGHVLVAPGDQHMRISQNTETTSVVLDQGPPEHSCRPAVDVLFRSVAATNLRALAVVLTGMGHDGVRGCEAIRGAGGSVVVQDEATSVVWGMPGAISRAGLADRVLPLGEIASEILARTGMSRMETTGAA
jgi:two-component system chemotaxis response regulator CheB